MPTSQDLHDRIAGQNVPKRFLANVARNGSTTVLEWKDASGAWQASSLEELAALTAQLTAGLQDLGVGHGDTVVLMIRNRPEFHALDLAVLFCGATPVSIYNSSAPEQVEYLVNDCKAKVAIVEDSGFLERFLKVRASLPTLEQIVLIEPSDLAGDDVVRYSDLAAFEPADLAAAAETATLDDLATIIYTSGTTGPPKGVMLSHSNVLWTLESVGQIMRDQTSIADFAGKRHVSYLPMAHIMERLLGHYYLVDFATLVACCPETSQMAAVARDVHPNLFIGVPRVWEKLHAGVNGALAADPEKKQGVRRGDRRGPADHGEDDPWHRHRRGDGRPGPSSTRSRSRASAGCSASTRPRSRSPVPRRSRPRSSPGSGRSGCRSPRATACPRRWRC